MINKLFLLANIIISSTVISLAVGNTGDFRPYGYNGVKQIFVGGNNFATPHASAYSETTKNAYFLQSKGPDTNWELSYVNDKGGMKFNDSVINNVNGVFSVNGYIFAIHDQIATSRVIYMAKDISDPKNLSFKKLTLPAEENFTKIMFASNNQDSNLINVYTNGDAGKIKLSAINLKTGVMTKVKDIDLVDPANTVSDFHYNISKNSIDILVKTNVGTDEIEEVNNFTPLDKAQTISTGYGSGHTTLFSIGENFYAYGGNTGDGLMYGTNARPADRVGYGAGVINAVSIFGDNILLASNSESLWYLPINGQPDPIPHLYANIWNSFSSGYELSFSDIVFSIPDNSNNMDRLYFSAKVKRPAGHSKEYNDIFITAKSNPLSLTLIIGLGVGIPVIVIAIICGIIIWKITQNKNSFTKKSTTKS